MAIAVIGSVTVLPAILELLGDRIDKGRLPKRLRRAPKAAGTGAWATIAAAVTRRPMAALVTSVCILGALAAPVVDLDTNDAGIDSLPAELSVVQAQRAIERDFPGAPSTAKLVVTGEQLGAQAAELEALGDRAAQAVGGGAAVQVDVARDQRTAIVGSRCRPTAPTPSARRSTRCATTSPRPRRATRRSSPARRPARSTSPRRCARRRRW